MLNKGGRRLTVRGYAKFLARRWALIIPDRSASMKSEHTTGSLPMGNYPSIRCGIGFTD
jgi:hypothetical protein